MGFHGGGMMGGRMRRMLGREQLRTRDTRAVLRQTMGYLKPFRPQLLLVLTLIVVGTLAQLAGPYLIGLAIDRFIVGGDEAGLARTMLLLLGAYAVSWVTTSGQFYLMTLVAQQLFYRLRSEVFDQLQRLSLSFYDLNEAGDLMSRLTNDTDTIGRVMNMDLMRMIQSLLTLVGIVLAMLKLNVRLALVSYTILPIMVIATAIFSQRARRAFRRTRETIGQVSAELEEGISGVKVVQAFSREEISQARFAQASAADRDANIQAVSVTSAFSPTMDVLSTVATAIVAGYGGYLLINDLVTVGIIVSFLTYVRRFYQPIQAVSMIYTNLQSALAGAERIFELLDEPVTLVDVPDAMDMPRVKGHVAFDDVSFAYRDDEPVLENVSLVAEPGQMVALVGETGAGKTTVANLIARFYDVKAGAVRIDGHDVRSVTRASLRRQMGIVLQDPFLFSDTVADNIRYGRLGATDDEVEAAARLVSVDNFVSRLPDGYQTELTERGSNLSQGQRQLISFARAILADPRILILDEATSSVDTRTERLIQQALGHLLQGRTSFVIAHRLSTVREADQVLVIEDGRIVERGTHETLLARKGVYYRLYISQFRRQEPGGDGDGRLPVAGQLSQARP
jgi:ATP-binding cassette subfamily B protein/subfamily B ATP-binding cassette protein MsbA